MEHPADFHRHRTLRRGNRVAPAPMRPGREGRVVEFRRPRPRSRWFDWRLLSLGGALGVMIGLAGAELTAPELAGPKVAGPVASGGAVPLISASFGLCHVGGGTNCVVDGDTFWVGGEKVRIAGIDAPETHPSRCEREAELGAAATARLQALLNAGPFTLTSIDRDTDRYGRKLRNVERDGNSLGDVLIAEGLARPYGGGRQPWC